ncbi:hypothetical protein P344_05275 [Spiroplasma mirum ATCC 29335]|uniref:RNA pseudouridylate synthase n=1 Tax=Spiroplasma mirum ATCC 29335 TaxID=838561 RepID=W0GRU9_9MOLU|nr:MULTISPECIES: RluA family pseudouridine synthase [Spiroplasma]AHF61276.1 ribosomal large subunit pseudouridine synthase C [Spiroplasma mirum ATCC 29335]AHI58377.1 hypothetical protein P344_05275 [Spiroplasma mirum ATCC 29335]AKM53339.1 ribosomal large subunit pseudouridine synthase C [Spiroplasma atrichopogonis]
MNNNIIKLTVNKNDANQTIFNFIKKMFKTTSLSVLYKLFRNKKIKVNNKVVKDRSYHLQENDVILIFDKALVVTNRGSSQPCQPQSGILPIVYEDDNILIVDKPHGVEMHSNLHESLDGMVRNYLITTNQYQLDQEQSFVISHLHRLDKFTRGLVIYVKNKITLDLLLAKINNKNVVHKTYLAKCEDDYQVDNLVVEGYLTKNEDLKKMVFTPHLVNNTSKDCATQFKTLKIINNTTWLRVTLLTGRKHQIRATLSYLHHPVVNDVKYGAKKITPDYMIYLYAYQLAFANLTGHLAYLNEKVFKIQENIIK